MDWWIFWNQRKVKNSFHLCIMHLYFMHIVKVKVCKLIFHTLSLKQFWILNLNQIGDNTDTLLWLQVCQPHRNPSHKKRFDGGSYFYSLILLLNIRKPVLKKDNRKRQLISTQFSKHKKTQSLKFKLKKNFQVVQKMTTGTFKSELEYGVEINIFYCSDHTHIWRRWLRELIWKQLSCIGSAQTCSKV